jgi:hypothetical protein
MDSPEGTAMDVPANGSIVKGFGLEMRLGAGADGVWIGDGEGSGEAQADGSATTPGSDTPLRFLGWSDCSPAAVEDTTALRKDTAQELAAAQTEAKKTVSLEKQAAKKKSGRRGKKKQSCFGRCCDAVAHCVDDVAARCRLLTASGPFQGFIIGAIFVAGANVGIATYPKMADNAILARVDQAVLLLFILECGLKIAACGRMPWRYWTGAEWSWNNFDFWIVVASLPGVVPGDLDVRFLRLLRLMRVTKLLGKVHPLSRSPAT